MKTRQFSIPAFLMSILLAAAVSFSCAMCLARSFSVPFEPKVLLFSCLGFSVLASSFLALRRSWAITALAALFYGGMLWFFRDALLSGLDTAAYYVTENYSRAYAAVSVVGSPEGDCTGVLTILALPLAWITAWTVNREGSVILAALACAPILILCLTIVDLAPTLWLIVLTGALLLLLLTNGVRERDPHQGGRLAWLLLLPTAAVIAVLCILSPPEDYARAGWITQLQAISEQAVGMDWEDLRPTADSEDETPRWSRSLQEVDLSQVGPRIQTHVKVLEYTADTPISYLRGVSLGIYADNTWSAVPQENFLAQDFDAASLMTANAMASASVTVRTVSTAKLLYTPYRMTQLPAGGQPVDDAYVDNAGGVTTYAIPYAQGSVTSPGVIDWKYENYVNENYTAVPDDLRVELDAILAREGLRQPASAIDAAASVAAYLKQLAVYDLNTPAVPEGEDFVLYFLTQSHQGYCVHFATAAALLLRTLDVPARYVTGYSLSGPEGQLNVVTTDEAHAWVEYYVNGIGWQALDPTPPALTQADGSGSTAEPAVPDSAVPEVPDTAVQTGGQDTEPGSTGSAIRSEDDAPSGNARWLLWLLPLPALALPALALLVCLRRWLVLAQKRKRWQTGHPNRRCLWLWRQLAQVSRITGRLPEEQYIVLAEKARFSQHTMTQEECALLAQAALEQTQALKQSAAPMKRLWQKYILALY